MPWGTLGNVGAAPQRLLKYHLRLQRRWWEPAHTNTQRCTDSLPAYLSTGWMASLPVATSAASWDWGGGEVKEKERRNERSLVSSGRQMNERCSFICSVIFINQMNLSNVFPVFFSFFSCFGNEYTYVQSMLILSKDKGFIEIKLWFSPHWWKILSFALFLLAFPWICLFHFLKLLLNIYIPSFPKLRQLIVTLKNTQDIFKRIPHCKRIISTTASSLTPNLPQKAC